MTILLVLIPLGIVLLIVAVMAFVWAVRSGQLEDLEGEGEPAPEGPRRRPR